ncbi:hypothetical protein [Paraburkholderia xenovorans]|uniref:hypothetical protein n=1 Tax=Paraburkholderia xenovorans TaxID=36873 RepID=UPI0020A6B769|nr:hypothetical protein [Paraburkholderia xenovorans]
MSESSRTCRARYAARRLRDARAIGAFRTFRKGHRHGGRDRVWDGTPMPVSATFRPLPRLGAAMGLGEADPSAFIDVLQTPRGGRSQ